MNTNFLIKFISVLIAAVFSIILYSCDGSNKIPEDDFIKIYSDIIIAQDTLKLSGEELLSIKKNILKKHNYSEQDYEFTVNYYNEDVKRWEIFFDKAIKYLEDLRKKEVPKP